ncbi:hypothetical protein B0H10DRAFT_2165675 [Mycena sp. CBHHK59/15]|nr:hypothetical protein B0H10DRAFT_2165675 [Mycena sp. CBHHK59/15]
MHLTAALSFISLALLGGAFTFERIDKNNSVLLVVDHQLVRDFGPEEYRNNILAHAAAGKVFNLPTILTTSAEDGRRYLAMHPNTPYIRRQGEVNAWDSAEFRAAVIMAGVVTDVCTTFLALSLTQDGYTVFANAGAGDVQRAVCMTTALKRDWPNTPEAPEMLPYNETCDLTQYGFVARAHAFAIANGTIQPGESV